jgi:hypothetical protein
MRTTFEIRQSIEMIRTMTNRSVKRSTLNPASWCLMLVLAALGAAGCNETFEPKGPYEQKLVVYSVLSNRADSLFVRVYSSYNPSGHNPLDNTVDTDVQGARVLVFNDSASYMLAGVVIPRTDKSRYATNINGYLAQPFPYQGAKMYTLMVTSTAGNVSAKVTTPGPGLVEANNGFVLKAPEKYTDDISAKVRLSPVTQGYLLRLYVEFDAVVGSRTIHVRAEVPKAIRSSAEVSFVYDYPILTRRITDRIVVYEVVYFALDAYKAFLLDQVTNYGKIELRSATFVLTQVESNLYKYYNLANGFLDEFSIRSDLPDFSNITGGFGVFGAMRDDSVVVDLH